MSLENIHKDYNNHTVLSFEKFHIYSGIYWLKGGNGIGKTTLFSVIAGQTSFHGQVNLQGINLKHQPVAYRALISYAEAEPQYPGYITGNDLIHYYHQVRRANPDITHELVGKFGMTPFMNQTIGGYSSGMLKKLSLICAFIGDISLFLLDEPLITIDTASSNVLYELINIFRDKGASFLISSHQEIDESRLSTDGTFTIRNKEVQTC